LVTRTRHLLINPKLRRGILEQMRHGLYRLITSAPQMETAGVDAVPTSRTYSAASAVGGRGGLPRSRPMTQLPERPPTRRRSGSTSVERGLCHFVGFPSTFLPDRART
jgi:hypothetical protein